MSQQDLIDRIVASLNEAAFDDARWPATSALIDEACRMKGNMLVHGEGRTQDDVEIFLARFCYRGQRHHEWEREYFRVYHPMDQLFLGTHLGPRWLVDRDTDLSVLASARQRWLGTVPDNRELGARLEVGHRVSQSVTVSGRAAWHGRRYRTRTALDGPVWDASLRGAWVITPTVRADLSLGYGRERPRRERERNSSRWLGVGVGVILPFGFTVSGGGDVRWTNYEPGWHPFVPDGGARNDRTHSLRASVHNRAFTLMGFSPALVVVREERATNAQAHDYERTRESFASCSSSENAPMILLEDWPLLLILVCGLLIVGMMVIFRLL